ncbi:hypothetical protein EHM76_00185 [bacterium]|nr:MAG: hypothetical protein EHM76_00185 [bacterium]
MRFFVGLYKLWHARHFNDAFVSVNRLSIRKRKPLGCSWIMDSGAFSELARHGRYRNSVADYAAEIERVRAFDLGLLCAVAQDYMCEPMILKRTGLTVHEHQALTIERYAELRELTAVEIMPVLQGYAPDEYVRHLDMYDRLLRDGAWVGVGSVCKRNYSKPQEVEHILFEIKRRRPDLRLHGFGLKKTALASAGVREMLHSADSMAWSYAASREGRRRDWQEARRFVREMDKQPLQTSMMPLLLREFADGQ